MSGKAAVVTAEQFWETFANLLRADLLAIGASWGETYKPSRTWTPHMVTSQEALLTRVGKALGYDVRREVDRIDVSYYGADDVCYVAIEHEGGPYHFPEGAKEKGWKHEFSLLIRLTSVPLRVLIIYDKGRVASVEATLECAVGECCPPDLVEVNGNSLLVVVGPWFDAYKKGSGLSDFVAYKFVDGHFIALPPMPILPR